MGEVHFGFEPIGVYKVEPGPINPRVVVRIFEHLMKYQSVLNNLGFIKGTNRKMCKPKISSDKVVYE